MLTRLLLEDIRAVGISHFYFHDVSKNVKNSINKRGLGYSYRSVLSFVVWLHRNRVCTYKHVLIYSGTNIIGRSHPEDLYQLPPLSDDVLREL